MPFDPKLIRPDDSPLAPDGETQLPGDLCALARQLGDDAAQLAACFPAPPRVMKHPASSPATRGKRIATATAALSGSALIVLLAAIISLRQSPTSIAIQANGYEQTAQSSFATKSIDPDSAVSLVDLSSPELEALLDLMQREPQSPVSISF